MKRFLSAVFLSTPLVFLFYAFGDRTSTENAGRMTVSSNETASAETDEVAFSNAYDLARSITPRSEIPGLPGDLFGMPQEPFPQDLFPPVQEERRSRRSGSPRSRGSYGYRGRRSRGPDLLKWDNNQEFKHDVFTFARIQYSYDRIYGRNRWGRPDWAVDMPDSDNNFSFRLQQLTSMKVHFEPLGAVVVRLDEDEIYNYPFCYLIEPGRMNLSQAEVLGMRRYLNRGGFIMVDDFWGYDEWYNFRTQMERVFPKLRFEELDIKHDIFNIVYKLDQKPQIPSIGHYYNGRTSDRPDAKEAHYWELKDENGRPMMIVCHNTDLGDGWEREGMDAGYFKTYSERWAYPLGINILTYAMTR